MPLNPDNFDEIEGGDGDETNREIDSWGCDHNDSMDGDHESGLASAGWGTDEDYGCFGGNEDY